MPAPRWKGSSEMKESPDSPEYSQTKDGIVHTRTFHGSFTTLVANAPQRFQTMTGSPSSILVDTVRITKGKGGTATMVVTLVSAPTSSPEDGSFPVTGVSTVEVEWVQTQKRLETHPRYLTGGAKHLTDADLDAIEDWKTASNSADRATKYSALSDNAKEFAGKLKRGTDSYVVYSPVIRITTPSRTRPETGKCGFKSNPRYGLEIEGYEFLKTADRATKQGRTWIEVEEWTGAVKVDTDLYPSN